MRWGRRREGEKKLRTHRGEKLKDERVGGGLEAGWEEERVEEEEKEEEAFGRETTPPLAWEQRTLPEDVGVLNRSIINTSAGRLVIQ